jgi:2-polyprenyl-3-methyl-5-hydroxy-6-metoxy-1,4-benzoquinol methylase
LISVYWAWPLPSRVESPELLDLGEGAPGDVAENLREMWRINRYLGGLRALTAHLYPRLENTPITLVDLGTGAGEIPLMIAKRKGAVRVLGLDHSHRNLLAIKHQPLPNLNFLQADAVNLPFAPNSVDYFISSLFLHHFTPGQIIPLLQSAFQRAKRGIIMSDIVRGWLPIIAFKLASPLFARNYLTRHDGVLSIRRAYTPAELLELALSAGLPNPRIYTHFPWRMTLVAEK